MLKLYRIILYLPQSVSQYVPRPSYRRYISISELMPQNGVWHQIWPKCLLNTLRPRQNGRHFPDAIFKWIFLNENVWISINISLKFVPRGPINNIPTLVQVMAWRRPGDKPLSEQMMVRLLTHICVTQPQWVNYARCRHEMIVAASLLVIFPSSRNKMDAGTISGIVSMWQLVISCQR